MSSKLQKAIDEGLFEWMAASDDSEASDGAWWCMLEDSVNEWNKIHNYCLDNNDTVHAYLSWRK